MWCGVVEGGGWRGVGGEDEREVGLGEVWWARAKVEGVTIRQSLKHIHDDW